MGSRDRKRRILTVAAALAMAVMVCVGAVLLLRGERAQTPKRGDGENREYMAAQEEDVSSGITFSAESGNYAGGFYLELSVGKGDIYYTLDGSNPVTSKTRKKYQEAIYISERIQDENVVSAVEPILFDAVNVTWDSKKKEYKSTVNVPQKGDVDKITVVKAVAVSGKETSEVQTHSYFVGNLPDHIDGIGESCEASGKDLAVISLSMEYDDLFDAKKGIYVKGEIFQKALEKELEGKETLGNAKEVGRSLDANYKQRGRDWERPVHMDYFESNGKDMVCRLQQDCGMRIQGNYSRSDLQKGLRLCARRSYGENNFNYPFFGEDARDDQGNAIEKFKKITLRNGGNCAFTSKYNDAFWQSLIRDKKVETQASRPCVVYLNGEYWGLYILQEDYSADYLEETHGVNKDDVVSYKGDGETYEIGYKLDEGTLPEGESVDYYFRDLLNFYKKHKNLKSKKDYDAFAKLVDVESVRDYFAVNVWINNKWDWPGKNWTAWKVKRKDSSNPYADGRWRLCFYDLDFGGVSGKSDITANTIQEDGYQADGLLDMGTENPMALMFAYLMTNKDFREDYIRELLSLSKTNFKKETAQKRCDFFNDTYYPLFWQFFVRYMGQQKGTNMADQASEGGYATYRCIMDFLEGREKYIPEIVDWIREYYQ